MSDFCSWGHLKRNIPKQDGVRYAVVRSHGCYSEGETVYAARVCGSLRLAEKYAAYRTRQYQADMRPHGGSSGGYRVVEVTARSRAGLVWRGWELDATPDAGADEEQVEVQS